jgi:hypothetical protein
MAAVDLESTRSTPATCQAYEQNARRTGSAALFSAASATKGPAAKTRSTRFFIKVITIKFRYLKDEK